MWEHLQRVFHHPQPRQPDASMDRDDVPSSGLLQDKDVNFVRSARQDRFVHVPLQGNVRVVPVAQHLIVVTDVCQSLGNEPTWSCGREPLMLGLLLPELLPRPGQVKMQAVTALYFPR